MPAARCKKISSESDAQPRKRAPSLKKQNNPVDSSISKKKNPPRKYSPPSIPAISDFLRIQFDLALRSLMIRCYDTATVEMIGKDVWSVMVDKDAQWFEFTLLGASTFGIQSMLPFGCSGDCTLRDTSQHRVMALDILISIRRLQDRMRHMHRMEQCGIPIPAIRLHQ